MNGPYGPALADIIDYKSGGGHPRLFETDKRRAGVVIRLACYVTHKITPAESRGRTRTEQQFSIVISRRSNFSNVARLSPRPGPSGSNVSMAKQTLFEPFDRFDGSVVSDAHWQLSASVRVTVSTMFWGSSPSVDLGAYGTGSGHLKVLIVSAGDTRHVLHTLAKRYKYSYAKIDIYVYEPVVELYARHAQQIALALEPIDRISLSYKVRAAIRNPRVRGRARNRWILRSERTGFFLSLSFRRH